MHLVMRNVLLACASVASLCSVASADPLAVAATTSDEPAPSTYVQVGVMAGGNDGLATAAGNTEIGKRVASILWVHASFTMGAAAELFASGSGTIVQARAGGDLMPCSDNGKLCVFAGADVGMQSTQYSGMETPWFCGGDYSCEPQSVEQSRTRMIGVGRVGLDLGGPHLRWRPGIEAAVGGDGINGVNLTQSLAYRF